MAPSIRVTPEGYQGLKKLIDAGYANTMSGVIERFVKEEGVGSEKSDEKISVNIEMWDVYGERRMLAITLSSKLRSWRRIAHIFSDKVYE